MPLEQNYWLTTAQMPQPGAEPMPDTADVAVIGAGFTGLSAALALAKRGAKVVVLESETIGWGASSRNGGMVLTGLKLGANQLISTYGRDLARRMYAASLESIASVERIVKEENIACDFARTGHLEVAYKQMHFDDYARQVEVIGREFNHQRSGTFVNVIQRNPGSFPCSPDYSFHSSALCMNPYKSRRINTHSLQNSDLFKSRILRPCM